MALILVVRSLKFVFVVTFYFQYILAPLFGLFSLNWIWSEYVIINYLFVQDYDDKWCVSSFASWIDLPKNSISLGFFFPIHTFVKEKMFLLQHSPIVINPCPLEKHAAIRIPCTNFDCCINKNIYSIYMCIYICACVHDTQSIRQITQFFSSQMDK